MRLEGDIAGGKREVGFRDARWLPSSPVDCLRTPVDCLRPTDNALSPVDSDSKLHADYHIGFGLRGGACFIPLPLGTRCRVCERFGTVSAPG